MFQFTKRAATVVAAMALMSTGIGRAHATTVVTFEGLQNQEPILNYYDGGLGGNGSGPGPNYGITFSPNSLALTEGALGSNFSGEPSPANVAFFLSGGADTLNDPAGFDTGFSFYYSAINLPGDVKVYDGLNATGSVLADLSLPVTPSLPGQKYAYNVLVPFGVSFSGVAHSVDFGGTANQIAFDNITFGSATPMPGTGVVPEPGSLALLFTGGLPLLGLLRRRAQNA